jgi:hypothetical protein
MKNEMGWAYGTHGRQERCICRLVRRVKGKRLLGRCERKGKGDFKMDLQEVGLGGIDWIDVAQGWDRWRVLVNTVRNLRVPYNVVNLQLFNIHVKIVCELLFWHVVLSG